MILTMISGIPLFTTIEEAQSWALANSLAGYHTHTYAGKIGYMGGTTHAVATSSGTRTNPTPTRSSGSSGGGGY